MFALDVALVLKWASACSEAAKVIPATGQVEGVTPMLKTELCDRLGIDHPILSAGFGPGAAPDVVAAISNAGGCGVLGASGFRVPYLRELIGRVRALTSKPFGVNLVLEDIEPGPIEACLEERIPL